MLSRLKLFDNYRILLSVMQAIAEHFRTPTVDHFATTANHVCPHFNSYFWEPGYEAMDTFV